MQMDQNMFTSLTVIEIQIKITMRDLFALTRLANIKKNYHICCEQRLSERNGASHTAAGERAGATAFW